MLLAETIITGQAPDFNSQVFTALIAAVAGIATTWLTVRYKDRIIRRSVPRKRKDRMDTIFDGYEKLILQQQQEIERKQVVIENLETIVDKLERELALTRDLLNTTKAEVAETKNQNGTLRNHLTRLRKEYEPHTIENQ